MEQTNKRVRMNLSQTAKGLVQWDITAEFESVEEATKALNESIDAVRGIIKDRNLTEVSAA